MEQAGFYRHGKPVPGLFRADDLSTPQNADRRFKYDAVIEETKLNASAIFELSGSPCIYFKRLDQAEPTTQEINRIHKLAWNQGLAPLLWVVTPTRVLLYNAYAKPISDGAANQTGHVIDVFEQTEQGLRELNEFAGLLQFETGQFWQQVKARQIDRRLRVDKALLTDLEEAEKQLVANNLQPSVAHALLGRAIFIAYLQDRKILKPQFFTRRFQQRDFAEVLASKAATYELFNWVHQTFNGDLFPLRHRVDERSLAEINLVKAVHLEIVRAWLNGTEMKTSQQRFWPYDFSVVPIELISSIYEKFAHTSDAVAAKKTSTHYTPINVVDLVLSQVFEGLPADSNVLDLACGSGVFLVESLRRLVARKLATGAKLSRELVRETLYRQIYGVDINPEAIQIAAFSLYLTALDLDPSPQPPSELTFRPLIGRNLFATDAFDENAEFNRQEPFVSRNFGAVIGNPPWTQNKKQRSPVEYCERHDYPILREHPDQAFLWRVGDFSNKNTVIGMILAAKPFFSQADDASQAKKALLNRFKPRVLVNCSDLHQDGFFPTAVAPAIVIIAEGKPSTDSDLTHLVSLERTAAFKRHGIIEISSENIRRISVHSLAADRDALKVASWGSARDLALIQRLRDSYVKSTLGDLIERMKTKGWAAGQGFQKAGGKAEAPELYGKKELPSGEMPAYLINWDELKPFPKQGLHRPRKPKIYEAPLVITPRGLSKPKIIAAFSPKDVVYTELYYGISIPPSQVQWAHYINGVLNSSLATYFLFLTAAVWGVERSEIKPDDLLRLPLPCLDTSDARKTSKVIEVENAILDAVKTNSGPITKLQKQLDDAVFALYGLDRAEQMLVQDMVDLTVDLRMNREGSDALHCPTATELEAYAKELLIAFQPFFQALNEHKVVADIFEVSAAPLQVVKFSFVDRQDRRPFVHKVEGQELRKILEGIASQLSQQVADKIFTQRVLRIYLGNDIYIIKPAQRRYWSRSAALNDADTILAEQLGRKA